MRKEPPNEFNLPKINVKCIQKLVKENSTSFASILKNNQRRLWRGSNGVNIRVKSEFSEANHRLSFLNGQSGKVAGKLVSNVLEVRNNKSKGIDSNQEVDPLLENSPTGTGCVALASNLGWGSEDEGREPEKEVRSHPTRCSIKSEVSSELWNEDFSGEKQCEPDSSVCHGIEFLCHIDPNSVSKKKTELPSVPKKEIEFVDCHQSQTDSLKPVKNYTRKINNSYPIIVATYGRQIDVHQETDPGSAVCVISEVIGSAEDFFNAPSPITNLEEAQLITPKKTNDITKIKGWRRKQFFMEKPTTVEFEFGDGPTTGKEIEGKNNFENVKNAFLCDSLDEFLDREAELKINYEIPHLYAEYGIKLTSDEILSRPHLSEEDFKNVESKYRVPVQINDPLIDIFEDSKEGMKRCLEDEENVTPLKIPKLEPHLVSRGFTDKPKLNSKNLDLIEGKNNSQKFGENMALASKLIGLVVYPGPFSPLNPIVQYHLHKLRSYHTKIDKYWADFAASAVLVKKKLCNKRKILPVYCCVKIEKNNPVEEGKDVQCLTVSACDDNLTKNEDVTSKTSEVEVQPQSSQLSERMKYLKSYLKACSVRIERFDMKSCCKAHDRYKCEMCAIDIALGETIRIPHQASFDNQIVILLAKKLKKLRYNDTLISIDCLKNLPNNAVEFIKLNFVKQSFLTGYINIWFLKPEASSVRSRAFLTFSQTPPVPNAINLKSSVFSTDNLPKVITEIVSAEDSFDSNEYAILHCNGKIWEIHGSLNMAFGKTEKDVDQIFTPKVLPELVELHSIAMDVLHMKGAKWWVLDLTQDFKELEMRSKSAITVVTRDRFLTAIKSKAFGFKTIKRNRKGRVTGAFIIEKLLPFVLIGPYHPFEKPSLLVKNKYATIPFTYHREKNVSRHYELKFFINSVLQELHENHKKLEGLWLYDKMYVDNTCYLEVLTKKLDPLLPKQLYTISIEHGYSLNSFRCPSPSALLHGIDKSIDGQDEVKKFKKIKVFLYFEYFDLGYVEGLLDYDNSVIISHPLDNKKRMKSHKIGDWFVSIIKERIQFIPRDLRVRWFITRHKEDLRGRSPFNKFFLHGAHILCKSGLIFLLKSGVSEVKQVSHTKDAERETTETKNLKQLASMISNKPFSKLKTDQILSKAKFEIKRQEKMQRDLLREKKKISQNYSELLYNFLQRLQRWPFSMDFKIKVLYSIVYLFTNKDGLLYFQFIRIVRKFRFGRVFLKQFKDMEHTLFEKNKKKSDKNDPSPHNDITKLMSVDVSLDGSRTKNPEMYPLFSQHQEPQNVSMLSSSIPLNSDLNEVSNLNDSVPTEVLSEVVITNEETGDTSPNVFKTSPHGFVALTSTELPLNIKVERLFCYKEIKPFVETSPPDTGKSQKQSGIDSQSASSVGEVQNEKVSDSSTENSEANNSTKMKPDDTSLLTANKIIIIKNFKNNKSTIHRLNSTSLPNTQNPKPVDRGPEDSAGN